MCCREISGATHCRIALVPRQVIFSFKFVGLVQLMIRRVIDMIVRVSLVVVALALLATIATSGRARQNGQEQKSTLSVDQDKTRDDASRPFTELEDEMRAKRAIKFADKEYQENLERARDLSLLSTSIVSSFKQKNELDQENLKKLEKVEKLAKSIRHAAGGSEDEVEMEKPPADLASAVDMLADLSKSLKEKVEKTPKHVISASVIDEANVLLELIRIVRTLPRKV